MSGFAEKAEFMYLQHRRHCEHTDVDVADGRLFVVAVEVEGLGVWGSRLKVSYLMSNSLKFLENEMRPLVTSSREDHCEKNSPLPRTCS